MNREREKGGGEKPIARCARRLESDTQTCLGLGFSSDFRFGV